MRIAVLGDVVFEVGADAVRTLSELEYSGSAQVQTHTRHLDKQIAEFAGADADKVTFTAVLSRHLGADPDKTLQTIRAHMENGDALQLIVGTKKMGSHMWIIKSYRSRVTEMGTAGMTLTAEVTLQLIEYVKE